MAKTHFTLAIVWRRIHGKIEFLVIDYTFVNSTTGRLKKQVKFPGGTNAEHHDETPLKTLVHEVRQETGLILMAAREIWKSEANAGHTKYGFLTNIDDCRGALRTDPLDDNGDILSPPYWLPVATLGRVLYDSHQYAYLVAARTFGVF